MTSSQPIPPAEGGRDILTILLISVAAGIALIAGLIVILISFAPDPAPLPQSAPGPIEPVESFDPSAPAPAPAPTDSIIDCGQPCFGVEDARALAPTTDALSTLGSPALVELLGDTRVQADWEQPANELFYLGGGAPPACVFAISAAPVAPQSQSHYDPEEPAVDLGTYSSGGLTATHVARVMESVLWGTRYPNSIRSAVDRCPGYVVTLDGTPRDAVLKSFDLDVSRAGVTDVGWTQAYGNTRTTTVDFQRGNLVVRVSIARDASVVSDVAVAEYLAAFAADLSTVPAP